MKIVDNAKKQALPPRYAIYDETTNTLTFYASHRGFSIGRAACFRRYHDPSKRDGLSGVAFFRYSSVLECWRSFETNAFCYTGRATCDTLLEVITNWAALRADLPADGSVNYAAGVPADAPADAPAYQRRVSCAGSPASVRACVVFTSGGVTYVRGYQSAIRAWKGYEHYTSRAFSSACILYRYSDGWAVGDSVFCRASPVPYTEMRAFENVAFWNAVKHFGEGAVSRGR